MKPCSTYLFGLFVCCSASFNVLFAVTNIRLPAFLFSALILRRWRQRFFRITDTWLWASFYHKVNIYLQVSWQYHGVLIQERTCPSPSLPIRMTLFCRNLGLRSWLCGLKLLTTCWASTHQAAGMGIQKRLWMLESHSIATRSCLPYRVPDCCQQFFLCDGLKQPLARWNRSTIVCKRVRSFFGYASAWLVPREYNFVMRGNGIWDSYYHTVVSTYQWTSSSDRTDF